MIQVLLADDHKLVREGLQSVLTQQADDMQVVGQAANGLEVLTLLESQPADVVLTDIDMPEMNGIEAARQIRQRFPTVKALMLTMAGSEQWVSEALRAGAQGYLLKSAGHKELLHAIRAVYEGGEYFSTDLTRMLLKKVPTAAGQPSICP